MKQIVKIHDLPDALDMQELMEVKGGGLGTAIICIFSSAVKCMVAGSGVITNEELTVTD